MPVGGERGDYNLLNHEIYVTLFGVPDDDDDSRDRDRPHGGGRIYTLATHSLRPTTNGELAWSIDTAALLLFASR